MSSGFTSAGNEIIGLHLSVFLTIHFRLADMDVRLVHSIRVCIRSICSGVMSAGSQMTSRCGSIPTFTSETYC